jgi:hypothetical protein
MSEEEKKAKKPAARKTTAKKETSAGKPAAKKAAPAPEEKVEEKIDEQVAEVPPAVEEPEAAEAGAEVPEEEPEMSEEEFKKFLEEQMEKITVSEIVSRLMMDMASLAYQKMGLPEEVNLKYRDFDQARLAIDALKGLLGAMEGKVPEGEVAPYRGTLANLQMNFVRLAKPGG